MHLHVAHGAVLVGLQVTNDAGFTDCGDRGTLCERGDKGTDPWDPHTSVGTGSLPSAAPRSSTGPGTGWAGWEGSLWGFGTPRGPLGARGTLTGVQALHDGGGVDEVAAAEGAHQVRVQLRDLYPGGPVHLGAAPGRILPAGNPRGPLGWDLQGLLEGTRCHLSPPALQPPLAPGAVQPPLPHPWLSLGVPKWVPNTLGHLRAVTNPPC